MDFFGANLTQAITCYWQTRRNRDTITFDEWVDLDEPSVVSVGREFIQAAFFFASFAGLSGSAGLQSEHLSMSNPTRSPTFTLLSQVLVHAMFAHGDVALDHDL